MVSTFSVRIRRLFSSGSWKSRFWGVGPEGFYFRVAEIGLSNIQGPWSDLQFLFGVVFHVFRIPINIQTSEDIVDLFQGDFYTRDPRGLIFILIPSIWEGWAQGTLILRAIPSPPGVPRGTISSMLLIMFLSP